MLVASLLGAGLGFVSAVPVSGPISALVFTQGMRGRFLEARWLAFGAALIESVYVFLAYWGVSQALTRYPVVGVLANVASAILLLALGVYFIRSKKMRAPPSELSSGRTPKGGRAFFSGALICALNPTLIATWAAAFATLHALGFDAFSWGRAVGFSLGVAVGIFAWFACFLMLIRRYRGRLNARFVHFALLAVGCVLIALSLVLFLRLSS